MADTEYVYSLAFRAPVSIFSGLGIAGLVDRSVVRDADGLPYIPGSSVKGRLRFFAERLLRTGAPPAGYWIHSHEQPSCKAVATACTVCRLFGSPSIPALLQVGQACLDPQWETLFRQLLQASTNSVLRPDAEIRPGIALSRFRRTALPDHLFFDEAIPAITFSGTLFLDARVNLPEAGFLIGVGRLVDALGARKATGRGMLEEGIHIEEAGR